MGALKTYPSIFAVGKSYQLMIPVSEEVTMWVRVGDKTYYDETNGILRSKNMIHRVVIPMKALDGAGEYTLCYRRIFDRKPYYTESGDIVQEHYTFRPLTSATFRAYHISDSHSLVDEPIAAAKLYADKFGAIDLLILSGDIAEDSDCLERFCSIYMISGEITRGEIPIVFARGNHDMRGAMAEYLTENTPNDNARSYYTFRLGAVWGMVLDCAEDKPDDSVEYGNTICAHAFRMRESEFIEQVISECDREYLADGVERRIIVVHAPFIEKRVPPFNIEEDTYAYWAKLLRENVHPDVMLTGHKHKLIVSYPGDELDEFGSPSAVVVAGVPDHKGKTYTGAGYLFDAHGMSVTFCSNLGVVSEHYIKFDQ